MLSDVACSNAPARTREARCAHGEERRSAARPRCSAPAWTCRKEESRSTFPPRRLRSLRLPTSGWTLTAESCSVRAVTGADIEARVGADDSAVVARLRDGDERAFEEVVRDFYPSMIAVARGYTRTRAVADEVVQEAWLGVLKGIDRFEGRSSLRTWVLQIVGNIARTRAVREARSVPFSSFESDGGEP